MGAVVQFPTSTDPQGEPNEFTFWVEILDDLTHARRHHLIDVAFANHVFDISTAETLHAMWQEGEGA